MADYAATLARLRSMRGVTTRALAAGMGWSSHTFVVRSEAGERAPADAEEVLRVARVLGLGSDETDELLTSAGFWPEVYLAVGPDDPTLRRMADALAAARGGDAERVARLRRVVDALLDFVPAAARG